MDSVKDGGFTGVVGLPEGYRLERAVWADIEGIIELVHASETVYLGYPDMERSEVMDALAGANDSWVVRDGNSRLVGWGQLYPSDWFCDAYARPGEGPQVQRVLIELLIERAGESVVAKAGALAAEEQYIGVLADLGFEFDHLQARMTRPLSGDEQPPDPVPGHTIRAMRTEELPACADLLRAAFGDHQDYAATPSLRPAECLVAETETGELAGVLLSTAPLETTGEGWVKWLGVHPDHRRHGLAAALLATAIAANARKGRKAIGLGVDTSSPTKAITLYERLGFTVAFQANIYRRDVGEERADTMGA